MMYKRIRLTDWNNETKGPVSSLSKSRLGVIYPSIQKQSMAKKADAVHLES